MMKWIPVKKELPPVNALLIVTIFDTYERKKKLRYPVYYCKPFGSDSYNFYVYGIQGEVILSEFGEVLAWMPIPKPWEGEEDGE